MFFESWNGLARVLIVGVLAYAALIVFLRVSGKRTLAKLNAFDLVVTVALGSTLATILLSKDVALAEGLLAFALLITLQFIIAWLSARSRLISNLVKAEPLLLLHRGELLPAALRRARVTEDKVRAAARGHGLAMLEEIEAIVLETDGSLSVVRHPSANTAVRSALVGVRGIDMMR